VEWLKRRVRGTFVHRMARRWRDNGHLDLRQASIAYDRQTADVMRRVLRPDSNCIDVGAHVGDILRDIVAVAPEGTHYAFEALPHLCDALKTQFPTVQVLQAAVSDRSGHSEFQYVENDPAYSGLRRRDYNRPDPHVKTIQVVTTTIDEVVPRDRHIAFIKIDIEGGEYHALLGAHNTIKWSRPVVVFEAGLASTRHYGVSDLDFYSLVVAKMQYDLSTMARWLEGRPPYTLEEFRYNWKNGPDYYFIATPKDTTH